MASLPFAVIPLSLGTITTGNQRTEKPAAHLGAFSAPGLTWSSNGNSNLWVRCDRGVAEDIDFVGVLAANAQSGTTIRVRLGDNQTEVDGTADYDSTALTFISPARTRADGLYHSHLELPSVQTKRWLRIDIGDHTGDFEAAALVIGKKITPATFYSPGWQRGFEDLGEIEETRFGVADEQAGVIYRTLLMRFGWLSESDYETKFAPLQAALGQRGRALWCFDPASTVYRQDKTYFGRIKSALTGVHSRNTPDGPRYEQEFDILSMF